MIKKTYLIIFIILIVGCSATLQKNLTVSLGDNFNLKKDQSANIQDGSNSIGILLRDFTYSPCPKGANCFWSGLAVWYNLSINGKDYGSYSWNTPYNVNIIKTDYKTYAEFIISSAEADCEKMSNEH